MFERFFVYDSPAVLIGQIVGWIAMAVAFLRFQMKTTRQIRKVNVASSFLFFVHYAFLSAWSGAILFLLGSTRSLLLLNEKIWPYRLYVAGATVVLSLVISLFTFKSWIDILPILGIGIGALVDVQSRVIVIRGLGVFMHGCWLAFALLNGSQGAVVSTSMGIISNLIGFWRQHLYPYLRTKDTKYFKI